MSIKQGDRYIAGGGAGSVEIDNISISTNASNKIQSIGNINKNPATGALPVKYDWIGTLAQFNQQDIANTHPEWVCYVTDDISGGESVYTKEEVDEGFLATNKITNCITEIPQDIKLELNNGTLTLKAGSKVYNGDGTSYTNASDISVTPSWGTYSGLFVFPLISGSSIVGCDAIRPSLVFSGDTSPTFSGNYAYWFDTTTKKVKYTNNGGSSWYENRALPLFLATSSNGVLTSIDQVFNGFGYIGSTVFALPGVKGLISIGRNADGSLKSTLLSYTVVKVATATGNNNGNRSILFDNGGIVFAGNEWYYDEQSNYVTNGTTNVNYFIGGSVYLTNDKISNWNPKTAFHAVDYNDFINNIPHIVETYVNGTSWYRVYSDGWCEQGGANNSGDIGGWQTVSFIKPYSNTDYYISVVEVNSTYRSFNIDGTHSDYFRYEAISVVGNKIRWYACGYIS